MQRDGWIFNRTQSWFLNYNYNNNSWQSQVVQLWKSWIFATNWYLCNFFHLFWGGKSGLTLSYFVVDDFVYHSNNETVIHLSSKKKKIRAREQMNSEMNEHWSLLSTTNKNHQNIIGHHRYSAHHPKNRGRNDSSRIHFYTTLFEGWKVTDWIGYWAMWKNTTFRSPVERKRAHFSLLRIHHHMCVVCVYCVLQRFLFLLHLLLLLLLLSHICQKLIEPSKAGAFILPSFIQLDIFKVLCTFEGAFNSKRIAVVFHTVLHIHLQTLTTTVATSYVFSGSQCASSISSEFVWTIQYCILHAAHHLFSFIYNNQFSHFASNFSCSSIRHKGDSMNEKKKQTWNKAAAYSLCGDVDDIELKWTQRTFSVIPALCAQQRNESVRLKVMRYGICDAIWPCMTIVLLFFSVHALSMQPCLDVDQCKGKINLLWMGKGDGEAKKRNTVEYSQTQ